MNKESINYTELVKIMVDPARRRLEINLKPHNFDAVRDSEYRKNNSNLKPNINRQSGVKQRGREITSTTFQFKPCAQQTLHDYEDIIIQRRRFRRFQRTEIQLSLLQ